jgi:mannitol/fructose-specific phosphotransferase system IIA component (Ntr-type)
VFSDFEPAILAVFFTLAGMELSFEHILEVGLIAAIVFSFRIAGKLLAANWAMRLAGATAKVRRNLGMALVPQAGVAVGLVVLLQEDPEFSQNASGLVSLFVAVVLTVVTANELVGPILTRLALERAGEVGKDRMRLIDFIHEENILTELDVETKEQAIERLVSRMITSHHLDHLDGDELLASVLDREAQVSTCLGGGLAVPHGILPDGQNMLGVMGISREGLKFDTPDGHPVHCMVLLATPDNERDRHLQVLASLAGSIGRDERFQALLYHAKSPAHAYEILHDEEAESFNYFLED